MTVLLGLLGIGLIGYGLRPQKGNVTYLDTEMKVTVIGGIVLLIIAAALD